MRQLGHFIIFKYPRKYLLHKEENSTYNFVKVKLLFLLKFKNHSTAAIQPLCTSYKSAKFFVLHYTNLPDFRSHNLAKIKVYYRITTMALKGLKTLRTEKVFIDIIGSYRKKTVTSLRLEN